MALYGHRGLKFTPGERFEYSNYGFILAGVLIEKVSGMSYYDYVRKHIFEPAGMTDTGSLSEEESVEKRSSGYTTFGGGSLRNNADTLPYRGTSAGGGYSTVGDLFRFARALQSHRLLNAEYTRLVTEGKVTAMGRWKYAYGFMEETGEGIRTIGHGGGAPGMNGELKIQPGTGYVFVALANIDPPAVDRLWDYIAPRLPAR